MSRIAASLIVGMLLTLLASTSFAQTLQFAVFTSTDPSIQSLQPGDGGLQTHPLVAGRAGSVWFIATPPVGGSDVGSITPSGTISVFPIPNATFAYSSSPTGMATCRVLLNSLAVGVDGNLWGVTNYQSVSGGAFICPFGIAGIARIHAELISPAAQ